jgi:uncharacterized protein YcbK (DUF882 family)
MIQASDYFGRFKDSPEITDDIRKNVDKLLAKVSMLLSMIPYKTKITSGFRPKAYNKQIGGSVNSHHCYGRAIDLWDPDCVIGLWLKNNHEYLKQEGLYYESLSVTHKSELRKGRWIHLQIVPPRSGNIEFLP